MSLIRVPTVRTTFSQEDLTRSLIKSWFKIYQKFPKKESIGVIVAQYDLETNSGKSCWNCNLTNCKAPSNPIQDTKYCVLNGTWEIINGKKIILSPEDHGSWFLAFDNLDEGSDFYLDYLKNKRYRSSWIFVESGNMVAFVTELKRLHFFTAELSDYIKATNIYFKQFMKDQTFEKIILDLQTPKVVELATVDVVADPVIDPQPPVVSEPVINNMNIFQTIIEFIMKIFK